MSKSDIQAKARREVVSIASRMLDGEMPLIEGARVLYDLRCVVGLADSELFMPIVAFESDTDDQPVGAVRQMYSQEALAAKDQGIAGYLAEMRPEILETCRKIIDALQ